MLHTRLTDEEFILLTMEDDEEDSPWIVLGDAQYWATTNFAIALHAYARTHRPDWYVASMRPLIFWRPQTHVGGKLGPDVFVAFAENKPRQSYDLTAGEPVPLFVLEVVSPDSVERDVEEKRLAYDGFGVQEYALFAPLGELGYPLLQGVPA